MVLGTLTVLGAAGASAAYYTAANVRSAGYSKSSGSAYSLAEAGIATGLSILHAALDPRTGNLLPQTTITLPEGTATYSGTLDENYIWHITSTGTVNNPDGPASADATRTLTRNVEIRGLNEGATVGAWSRIYHNNTTYCLAIDTVELKSSITSKGDLCLNNGAKITGANSRVSVGDDVVMTLGSSGSPVESPSSATGWSNSSNVFSSNGSYATANIAGSGQSTNLDSTSWGFAIPATATITGIRARVERRASVSSRISDTDVYLLQAGVAGGTDKAIAGTWSTSDTYQTYGGSTDLWGRTWTPAQINAYNFGLRFRAQATSGTTVTASVDHVELTVWYTAATPSIGTASVPVEQADVFDTCKYAAQTANKPCSTTDQVYADTITTLPTDLTKPTVDLAYWYDHAKPGPEYPCTTGSFPNGFDTNGWYDNSRQGTDALEEITPTNSSYTCQYKDAGNNLIGEISWNHITHVMKIHGTVFIDGDMRFDDDGQLVNYQGRGIIYAAGDIEFDDIVCAGGDGTNNCIENGMENWDPTVNMMIVLSGDDSEYDRGGNQDPDEPSGFQGIVYAKDDCTIHENFYTSGPLICDRIMLPSEAYGYWPTYFTWPDLGTLVEGQKYGAPSTSPDFELVVGAQSG